MIIAMKADAAPEEILGVIDKVIQAGIAGAEPARRRQDSDRRCELNSARCVDDVRSIAEVIGGDDRFWTA